MIEKKRRAIVVGATSGIGLAVSELLLSHGWELGVAGRRVELLHPLKATYPDKVKIAKIDVTAADAKENLLQLIDEMGGIDTFLMVSGIGKQNPDLTHDIEYATCQTNVLGFVNMITTAYNYFKQKKSGHIVIVSSIAGTKGMGTAPAYSSSKRFQSQYLDSLEQLSYMDKVKIDFTDIKPGFVETALLHGEKRYPMLMNTDYVARKMEKAIVAKRRTSIIDWRYAILVGLWKIIPQSILKRLPIKN